MNTAETTCLTVEDAARFLGLSPSTLAKLRLRGDGPAYCKLGRRVVYLRRDLEEWLSSHRRRSTSELCPQIGSSARA